MSLDDPGREAIVSKGWLRAHKWLLLRRTTQLGFLGLFLVGPLTGFWLVKGNLASSLTLDTLPLTDPLLLLQSLAAGHLPETTVLIGAAIVLAAYLIVGGRTYCSWVCPVNVVTDAAYWLNRKLGLPKGWQPKAGTRYGMLALVLIGSMITGTIFWEFVNPVTMVHRALVFGLAGAWLIITAVFLFDLLVSRRGWCAHLCPVGVFYGQINRASLLKMTAVKRDACDDCMDCFAVCPEPQVITPALKGKGSPVVNHWACTNCARCIDVCSQDVYRFTLRGMETSP